MCSQKWVKHGTLNSRCVCRVEVGDTVRNIGIELIKIQIQGLVSKVPKTPAPSIFPNSSLISSNVKPKLCMHLPASLLCLFPFLCFCQIQVLGEDHLLSGTYPISSISFYCTPRLPSSTHTQTTLETQSPLFRPYCDLQER